eukprot:89300-Chlamydomonas_euryale.AAC.2
MSGDAGRATTELLGGVLLAQLECVIVDMRGRVCSELPRHVRVEPRDERSEQHRGRCACRPPTPTQHHRPPTSIQHHRTPTPTQHHRPPTQPHRGRRPRPPATTASITAHPPPEYEAEAASDYRFNHRLAAACAADVPRLCGSVCAAAGGQTCGGTVLRCLTVRRDDIEAPECRAEVEYFEKMEVNDFRNDVILAAACRDDVEKLCKDVQPGACHAPSGWPCVPCAKWLAVRAMRQVLGRACHAPSGWPCGKCLAVLAMRQVVGHAPSGWPCVPCAMWLAVRAMRQVVGHAPSGWLCVPCAMWLAMRQVVGRACHAPSAWPCVPCAKWLAMRAMRQVVGHACHAPSGWPCVPCAHICQGGEGAGGAKVALVAGVGMRGGMPRVRKGGGGEGRQKVGRVSG